MEEPLSPTTEVATNTHHEAPGILTPDVEMLILTWVTFFLLLGILYKFAWKPILAALEDREQKIRRLVEDARKAKEEYERIKASANNIISEADHKAKEIVERAQKAAQEAAKVIERRAKDEVQILLNNATQEIERQKEKVKVSLQEESAELAVNLAGKILSEQLDRDKHQKLIDRFIKDFHPEKHHENS